MFIRGEVAICATGPIDPKDITPETDVVYIKPKMDFGTRQRVIGAGARFEQQGKTKGRQADPSLSFDVGAYQIALLVHNIKRWEGPSFKGVPCSPENIEQIDADDPLAKRVLEEIALRNPSAPTPEGDDPNAPTPNA